MFKTDVVVIGAGIVGLAVARQLALCGLEVIVIEQENQFGSHTSSRNSEIIHAGIYYPKISLKAQLCVEGKSLLYEYCRDRHINHSQLGKFIVGTDLSQVEKLDSILLNAIKNDVHDLQHYSEHEMKKIYPQLNVKGALFSPSTGIVDSHGLMLSFIGDIEDNGSNIALGTKITSVGRHQEQFKVTTEDGTELICGKLINTGGLWASTFADALDELNPYQTRYAQGRYLSYSGKHPFQHLIYPVPVKGGLGTHLTLDSGGQLRLGPDVEWVDSINYIVKSETSVIQSMHQAVQQYWPDVELERLHYNYSGKAKSIQE